MLDQLIIELGTRFVFTRFVSTTATCVIALSVVLVLGLRLSYAITIAFDLRTVIIHRVVIDG